MDDLDKETKLRLTALDRAIYTKRGIVTDPDTILEAAKKFEEYLKGKNNNG